MITRSRFNLAASALLAASLLAPTGALAQISTADDICAPTADPCVLNSKVDVTSGSTLDFGTRAFQIVNPGQLDTNNGDVLVRCGSMAVTTGTNLGLKVRGPNGFGSIDGGILTIEARRTCSADANQFCFRDGDCKLGACTAHVCSDKADEICGQNADCDLGTCGANFRCSGNATRRCFDDTDCFFGTCLTGTTLCSSDLTRQCASDGQCDAGICNVGSGTVAIDGNVRADGAVAGALLVTAAGDVTTSRPIDVSTTNSEEDGGILQLDSGQGSVTVGAKLTGTGGRSSQGGDFAITSLRDVTINAVIDVNGGDFDGGFIEIDGGRDVFINADILANSTTGAGFGGDIGVFSGRDIIIPGPAQLQANGNTDAENFCGDGGPVEFDAGRHITVGPEVVLQSIGARPDCAGEGIVLDALGNVTVSGKLESTTRGSIGLGGTVEVATDGTVDFTSTAIVDVTGTQGGGGAFEILSGEDIIFDGTVDGSATNGGQGDGVTLDATDNITISGTITLGGTPSPDQINGIADIQACSIDVLSGALIDNKGGAGRNLFVVGDLMSVQNGAEVRADLVFGLNRIEYRDAGMPPAINGLMLPLATTVLNPDIVKCSGCGNGILEPGETCDDGNQTPGDGCNAECQNEGCIAATPGYPAVPLCDDGLGCTIDTCDPVTSQCSHVFDCNDAFTCTQDSCGQDGECQHVPNNALCNDGNTCTTDICNPSAGCISANNQNSCDDGVACTSGDTCSGGICQGTSNCPDGGFCNLSTGECSSTSSTLGPTTTTTLIGGEICGNSVVDPGETCDDGDTLWDTGQFCSAACTMLGCGDPDNSTLVNAVDALYVLRVAVGLSLCDACVCDVDSSGGGFPVNASDALRLLRAAVGIPIELLCPLCS